MGKKSQRPGLCYVYDTREKWPYRLAIPNEKWFSDFGYLEATLPEGDTSAELDCERLDIIIERKQLTDFLSCCGRDRVRFDNELARLASHVSAHIILECPVAQIRAGHPRSQMNGLSAWNSIAHWSIVYPTVHWWTVTNHVEGAMFCRTLIHEFAKHCVTR